VDTLLRQLLDGKNGEIAGWGPWTQVKCTSQSQVAKSTANYFEGDGEFEPADPNDTTVYSGQPAADGGGEKCTPIPDSRLVAFPAAATAGGPERALSDTVQRFMSMRAAAAKNGIDLKVSDGYRHPDEQLSAWKGNGCRLVNGKAVCAQRTAAVPCSLGGKGSNHTLGTAIDIRLTGGASSWLKTNSGTYRFYNKLGAIDPPHYSSTGY
jgi:hypothetical protein